LVAKIKEINGQPVILPKKDEEVKKVEENKDFTSID